MSRRTKAKQRRAAEIKLHPEITEIPSQPMAVQAYEVIRRQQKLDEFYGRCTFAARGPHNPIPELLGMMMGNHAVDMMMRAAVAATSKIVLPEGVSR